MPDNTFDVSGPLPGPVDDNPNRSGLNPASLPGIVIDNRTAKLAGKWVAGGSLDHIGADYVYARGAGNTATFEFTVPSEGRYEVRFATAPHENRASNTAITVRSAEGDKKVVLNQKQPAKIDDRWVSLGTYRFAAGKPFAVIVDAASADGNVHLDAVQVLPAK